MPKSSSPPERSVSTSKSQETGDLNRGKHSVYHSPRAIPRPYSTDNLHGSSVLPQGRKGSPRKSPGKHDHGKWGFQNVPPSLLDQPFGSFTNYPRSPGSRNDEPRRTQGTQQGTKTSWGGSGSVSPHNSRQASASTGPTTRQDENKPYTGGYHRQTQNVHDESFSSSSSSLDDLQPEHSTNHGTRNEGRPSSYREIHAPRRQASHGDTHGQSTGMERREQLLSQISGEEYWHSLYDNEGVVGQASDGWRHRQQQELSRPHQEEERPVDVSLSTSQDESDGLDFIKRDVDRYLEQLDYMPTTDSNSAEPSAIAGADVNAEETESYTRSSGERSEQSSYEDEDSAEDGWLPMYFSELVEIAREQWLSLESIAYFLRYRAQKAADIIYEAVGPVGPPLQPDSGSLFIVDEKRLGAWRQDGHTYILLNREHSPRQVAKQCVSGDDAAARCCTVMESDPPDGDEANSIQVLVEWCHVYSIDGLQRRAYCLYPVESPSIWLVQYLFDTRPPKHSSSSPPESKKEQLSRAFKQGNEEEDDDLPLAVDPNRKVDELKPGNKEASSNKSTVKRKGSKRLTQEQRVHAESRVAEIPRLSFEESSNSSDASSIPIDDESPREPHPASSMEQQQDAKKYWSHESEHEPLISSHSITGEENRSSDSHLVSKGYMEQQQVTEEKPTSSGRENAPAMSSSIEDNEAKGNMMQPFSEEYGTLGEEKRTSGSHLVPEGYMEQQQVTEERPPSSGRENVPAMSSHSMSVGDSETKENVMRPYSDGNGIPVEEKRTLGSHFVSEGYMGQQQVTEEHPPSSGRENAPAMSAHSMPVEENEAKRYVMRPYSDEYSTQNNLGSSTQRKLRNVGVETEKNEEINDASSALHGHSTFASVHENASQVSTQVANVLNESILNQQNPDVSSSIEAFTKAMQLWKEGNEAAAAAEVFRANVSREYLQYSLSQHNTEHEREFKQFAMQARNEQEVSSAPPISNTINSSVVESEAVVTAMPEEEEEAKSNRKHSARHKNGENEDSDSSSSAPSSKGKKKKRKRSKRKDTRKKRKRSQQRKHRHSSRHSGRRRTRESKSRKKKAADGESEGGDSENEEPQEEENANEEEYSSSSDEHYGVHSSVRASLGGDFFWNGVQRLGERSYALGSELKSVPGRPPMPPNVYESHASTNLRTLDAPAVQPTDHYFSSVGTNQYQVFQERDDQQYYGSSSENVVPEVSAQAEEQGHQDTATENANEDFLSYMRQLHQAYGMESNEESLGGSASSEHQAQMSSVLPATQAAHLVGLIRGHQIRALFRTKRVLNLARQIKDAQKELQDFEQNGEDDASSETFRKQLQMQVRSAVKELSDVTGSGNPAAAAEEWLKLRRIAQRTGSAVEATAAEREALRGNVQKADTGAKKQIPQGQKSTLKGGALGKRAMDYGRRVREANLKKHSSATRATGESSNRQSDDSDKPWKNKNNKKRNVQSSGISKGLQESGKWRLALEIVQARNLKQNSSDPNVPSAGPGMANQQSDDGQRPVTFKPKDAGSRDAFVSVCLMKKVQKHRSDGTSTSRQVISRRFDTAVVAGTLNPEWHSTKILTIPVKAANELEDNLHKEQGKPSLEEEARKLDNTLNSGQQTGTNSEENEHGEGSADSSQYVAHNPVECFPDLDWNGFGVYFEIQDSDRFTKDTFLGCGEVMLNDIMRNCRLKEHLEEVRSQPLQKPKPAIGFPQEVSRLNKAVAPFDNDNIYGGRDGESWIPLQGGKSGEYARGELFLRYRLIPPHPLLLTHLRIERYLRSPAAEEQGTEEQKSNVRSSGYGQKVNTAGKGSQNQRFLKRQTKTPSFQKLDWSNVKPKTITRPELYDSEKEKGEGFMTFGEGKPGGGARVVYNKPPRKDYSRVTSKVKTNNAASTKRESIPPTPRSSSREGSDVGFHPSLHRGVSNQRSVSRENIPREGSGQGMSPEQRTAADVVGAGSGPSDHRPKDKYGRFIPQSVSRHNEIRNHNLHGHKQKNVKKGSSREDTGGTYARAVNQWQDMLRSDEYAARGRTGSRDLEVDAGGAIEWMPGVWGSDDRLWIGGKEWDEIDSQMQRSRNRSKPRHMWPSVNTAAQHSDDESTEQAQWKEEAAEFAERLQRKMAEEMEDLHVSEDQHRQDRPPTPPPPPSSSKQRSEIDTDVHASERWNWTEDSAQNSPRLQRLERVFADMLSQHSTPHPESEFT